MSEEKKVSAGTKGPCPKCGGNRSDYPDTERDCPECNGTGEASAPAGQCTESDHRCPPGETKCYCGMYETAPTPAARMPDEEFERLDPEWGADAHLVYAEARRARESEAALHEEVERLSELLWGSRCVYCGEVVGRDRKNQDIADEVLRQHVLICPKHPAAALRERAEAFEKALRRAAEEIIGTPIAEQSREADDLLLALTTHEAANERLREALRQLFEECKVIRDHPNRRLLPHPLTMEKARAALGDQHEGRRREEK